ncbi:vacuolar protein sorting/targeting protein PEP1 [Marasmius sp. AFHP31]|nr:vacuolar protein sorting/targeting protein PEP1 [Marasmius sp. AFHP31]
MLLYVTVDTKTWSHAQFPHASSATLRENAYTIVESTTHSLAVDVVLHEGQTIGTLFVSNSNGTYFVESLKDTNRNEMGYVDFERVYGVEGVGLANIVSNADAVEGRRVEKQLQSRITFDDGRTWSPLSTGSGDENLHLHSVTTPHNFGRIFSSPAPGFVMGVGSVSPYLKPYEECDLFLSTDAGVTWDLALQGARKYEFGDSGSIIVAVDDEEVTDKVQFSLDMGKSWHDYKLDMSFRARALTTLPDSTSQKFVLVAQVARQDQHQRGRYAVIFLDFAETRKSKCRDGDYEEWFARPKGQECLMGHKQYYKRRKADVDCYVGDKFTDPVARTDDCECTDEDYECDFNFNLNSQTHKCELAGPEPVPEGVCASPNDKYMGSSGYRKIPGNTCSGGKTKDEKVERECKHAQQPEGSVVHTQFDFPATVVQHAYFKESQTILARTSNHQIWQSSNEGYSWTQIEPEQPIYAFYHHPHTPERGFLITDQKFMFVTTDNGRQWTKVPVPLPPNIFRAPVLRFQPESDHIIWIGAKGCGGSSGQPDGREGCHAEAFFSRNNGRDWKFVEKYVGTCGWAKDSKLNADPTEIICESYADKTGDQPMGGGQKELVVGPAYYQDAGKRQRIFESVVGFAKFDEFLVAAELHPSTNTLELQVSLDGIHFAPGVFPPSMRPETHAYTILESSTKSLFLHMTTSDSPPFGSILKSNSNGTYFVVSLDNVNRNDEGFVDFEKIIGLDGIALVNVVSNADRIGIGHNKRAVGKALQTRITHNDGGTWKPLKAPELDSLGQKYECDDASCHLQLHGYTDRRDARATFSSPSIVGLIMAVGNVGSKLLPYKQCDTFLSRDGGFTWREVRKDAHLWEFGDSGGVLVMVNDEEATDIVLYSVDQGQSWREYKFVAQGERKVRVRYLVTVPSDDSRRFILIGERAGERSKSVAIQVDFSALVARECVMDPDDPNSDDFELWSPSEERNEKCLFGRQTLYHRRTPEANCVVGKKSKQETKIVKHCPCIETDFECEFNHIRSPSNGSCILSPGTTPLPSSSDMCFSDSSDNDGYWYGRTAYRKIPYSTCEGGDRLDRGAQHSCPGLSGHGWGFWITMIVIVPTIFAAIVGMWFYKRSGMARGTIRLPGGDASRSGFRGSSSGGIMDTLASVPWFLLGLGQIAFSWAEEKVDDLKNAMGGGYGRGNRGYRNVPIDEDAQVLRFEDDE